MAYDQEVVGSNLGAVYWMDVSDAASHYIKENLKIKVAQKKFFLKGFITDFIRSLFVVVYIITKRENKIWILSFYTI